MCHGNMDMNKTYFMEKQDYIHDGYYSEPMRIHGGLPELVKRKIYERYGNWEHYINFLKYNGQIPEITDNNKSNFEEGI